jgi:hypothetical protein
LDVVNKSKRVSHFFFCKLTKTNVKYSTLDHQITSEHEMLIRISDSTDKVLIKAM